MKKHPLTKQYPTAKVKQAPMNDVIPDLPPGGYIYVGLRANMDFFGKSGALQTRIDSYGDSGPFTPSTPENPIWAFSSSDHSQTERAIKGLLQHHGVYYRTAGEHHREFVLHHPLGEKKPIGRMIVALLIEEGTSEGRLDTDIVARVAKKIDRMLTSTHDRKNLEAMQQLLLEADDVPGDIPGALNDQTANEGAWGPEESEIETGRELAEAPFFSSDVLERHMASLNAYARQFDPPPGMEEYNDQQVIEMFEREEGTNMRAARGNAISIRDFLLMVSPDLWSLRKPRSRDKLGKAGQVNPVLADYLIYVLLKQYKNPINAYMLGAFYGYIDPAIGTESFLDWAQSQNRNWYAVRDNNIMRCWPTSQPPLPGLHNGATAIARGKGEGKEVTITGQYIMDDVDGPCRALSYRENESGHNRYIKKAELFRPLEAVAALEVTE